MFSVPLCDTLTATFRLSVSGCSGVGVPTPAFMAARSANLKWIGLLTAVQTSLDRIQMIIKA